MGVFLGMHSLDVTVDLWSQPIRTDSINGRWSEKVLLEHDNLHFGFLAGWEVHHASEWDRYVPLTRLVRGSTPSVITRFTRSGA